MKVLHPTCGLLSLQRGSKLIAFIDMTLGAIGLIWFLYMLERYDIVSLDPFENETHTIVANNKTMMVANDDVKLDALGSAPLTNKKVSALQKVLSLSLCGFYTSVNLILFVVLLIGAIKKHIGLCLTWFYIRCAILVFKCIIFLMYLIHGRPLFGQIPFILFMFVHAYGLWVVNSYVEELRFFKYEKDLTARQIRNRSVCSSGVTEYTSPEEGYGGTGGGGHDGVKMRDGIEKVVQARKAMYDKEANKSHHQENENYSKM